MAADRDCRLEARLVFPTDEELMQLDEMLDTREALSRGGKRRVLARLQRAWPNCSPAVEIPKLLRQRLRFRLHKLN